MISFMMQRERERRPNILVGIRWGKEVTEQRCAQTKRFVEGSDGGKHKRSGYYMRTVSTALQRYQVATDR